MPRPPRYGIRLDGERMLEVTLPIDRAERVALHAVGPYGRHDTAELIDEAGAVVLAFARLA